MLAKIARRKTSWPNVMSRISSRSRPPSEVTLFFSNIRGTRRALLELSLVLLSFETCILLLSYRGPCMQMHTARILCGASVFCLSFLVSVPMRTLIKLLRCLEWYYPGTYYIFVRRSFVPMRIMLLWERRSTSRILDIPTQGEIGECTTLSKSKWLVVSYRSSLRPVFTGDFCF